jgi:F-type H+-transporting ATPase subunit b
VDGLGISLELLIAQLINFLILFGLLYAFAYKPFMRILDERSATVKEKIDKADHLKDQAAEAEKEAMRRLVDADNAGKTIMAQAARSAEETKRKALEEAKPEVEAVITRARRNVEQEREEVLRELKHEFTSLTISAAQKVIEQELDEEKHRKLIEKVFEESELLKK